jgi:ABC-2 type transport system permease protein
VYTAVALTVVMSYSGTALDISKFLLINASLLFLQLVLFAIGLTISVMLKKIKSVLPVSLGLVFMFFAISAFAVTSKDDKLRYLTPFQYFKVDNIVLVMVMKPALCTCLRFVIFE